MKQLRINAILDEKKSKTINAVKMKCNNNQTNEISSLKSTSCNVNDIDGINGTIKAVDNKTSDVIIIE